MSTIVDECRPCVNNKLEKLFRLPQHFRTVTKKTTATKIRPYEGDIEIAREIAKTTGLPLVEVLSRAMSAGLRAIKENGGTITLPLKFKVADPRLEKSEINYRSPTSHIVEEKDPKKGKK